MSRFLGYLGKKIREAKKYPDRSLIRRYIECIAALPHDYDTRLPSDDDSDDEAETGQPRDRHPLVPLGAVYPSSELSSKDIVWPGPTRATTRVYRFASKDTTEAEQRLMLTAILGPQLSQAWGAHSPGDVEFCEFHRSVQIGRWKYGVEVKESGKQIGKTRASWFWIEARHIPHLVAESKHSAEWQPNRRYYGRIVTFVLLTTKGWNNTAWKLAEVWLFDSDSAAGSDFDTIDITQPLCVESKTHVKSSEQLRGGVDVFYVQAKHLGGCIAIAPKPPRVGLLDLRTTATQFLVLPLVV